LCFFCIFSKLERFYGKISFYIKKLLCLLECMEIFKNIIQINSKPIKNEIETSMETTTIKQGLSEEELEKIIPLLSNLNSWPLKQVKIDDLKF